MNKRNFLKSAIAGITAPFLLFNSKAEAIRPKASTENSNIVTEVIIKQKYDNLSDRLKFYPIEQLTCFTVKIISPRLTVVYSPEKLYSPELNSLFNLTGKSLSYKDIDNLPGFTKCRGYRITTNAASISLNPQWTYES